VDEVVHYCVTNYAGAVARTSTFALNNVTAVVLTLAGKGPPRAREDPHLRNGLNVYEGRSPTGCRGRPGREVHACGGCAAVVTAAPEKRDGHFPERVALHVTMMTGLRAGGCNALSVFALWFSIIAALVAWLQVPSASAGRAAGLPPRNRFAHRHSARMRFRSIPNCVLARRRLYSMDPEEQQLPA